MEELGIVLYLFFCIFFLMELPLNMNYNAKYYFMSKSKINKFRVKRSDLIIVHIWLMGQPAATNLHVATLTIVT